MQASVSSGAAGSNSEYTSQRYPREKERGRKVSHTAMANIHTCWIIFLTQGSGRP